MLESFRAARETLQWAETNINAFEAVAIQHFSSTKSYFTVNRADDGNGWRMLLEYPAELPTDLRREATSALVNTRHAFDQVAYAAQFSIAGKASKHHSFPWASHPNDLESRLKDKRFDDKLWQLFRDERPYKQGKGYEGGDNLVRSLTELANDKHSIGLVIGVTPASLQLPRFRVVGSFDMILLPRANAAGEVLLAYGDGQIVTEGQCQASSTILFNSDKLPISPPVDGCLKRYHAVASLFLERAQAYCS